MLYLLNNAESILTAINVLWTAYLALSKQAKPKPSKKEAL